MIWQIHSFWAVIIYCVIWLLIHVIVSYVVDRIPSVSFDPKSWLYRGRSFERNGELYEAAFRIRYWKHLLPDGAALCGRFRKKTLEKSDSVYIKKFIQETCRAEMMHWILLAMAGVFFIWNDWWIGLIMVLYALIVNMPCIIAQRFNRIRLCRIYNHENPNPLSLHE